MKTALYILGFIALGLAALFGVALWVLSGAPSFNIAPRKTPPPDGFVAANFPAIADLAGTDAISVLNLGATYGRHFENYYLPDQQVAYFIHHSDEAGGTNVFINASGDRIGTIKDSGNRPFPIGNVFAGLDGYQTVTSDGVKPFTPYEVLEKDLTFEDLKDLHAESTYYRSFSHSDAGPDRPEYDAKLTTHVFLHEGVWKKAVTSVRDYIDWKVASFDDLDVQYEHSDRGRSPSWLKTFYGGKYQLRLTHFDQQDYIRKRGAPMGSTTGTGTPEHWRGTGYYTLNFGDDALRFSIPNDMLILSGGGRILMTLEGNEALDFVFLNFHGFGDAKESFIISTPQ